MRSHKLCADFLMRPTCVAATLFALSHAAIAADTTTSSTAQSTEHSAPLPVRRIITHDDKAGLSSVLIDGPAPNVIGGLTELWTTGPDPADHRSTLDRSTLSKSLNPPRNGTVFRFFQIPPQSRMAQLSDEEKRALWAGLFKTMNAPDAQPDTRRDPGMHRTPTTDYIILLSGQITLVLDKQEVDMRPFDTVIQRGTNHAWVNKGNEDTLLMAILVDTGQPK
jgi:mannose-6-phosphate isomerase-like protein (cupin superfamily)